MRAVATSVCVVLLFAVSLANASFVCGHSLPDSLVEISTEIQRYQDEVDSTMFVYYGNDVFPTIFKVYTNWDYTTVTDWATEGWDSLRLAEFAEYVIHNNADSFPDYANKVTQYFAEDLDSTHGGIRIGTYEEYNILLDNTTNWGQATIPNLSLGIQKAFQDSMQSPEAVANNVFLHEWQHIVHNAWSYPDSLFDKDYGREVNTFNSNELFSETARYLFGDGENTHTSSFTYNRSLHTFDHTNKCLISDYIESQHVHYHDLYLFASYLHDKLGASTASDWTDDVLYDWVHQYRESGDSIYIEHDLAGLGTVLADSFATSTLFNSSDEDGRVEELFLGYSLARYMNLQDQTGTSRLYTYMDDESPTSIADLFSDIGSHCCDNAASFPLGLFAEDDPDSLSGIIDVLDYGYAESCTTCTWDGWDHEDDKWSVRRLLGVSRYASEYLEFFPESGQSGDKDLFVEFKTPYWYYCPEGAGDDYWEVPFQHDFTLHVTALGFPDVPSSAIPNPPSDPLSELYSLGSSDYDIDVIESWEFSDPGPGEYFVLGVEDFGSTYEAVTLALTILPDEPTVKHTDTNPLPILPLEYSYYIHSDTATVVTGTIDSTLVLPPVGGGDEVFLLGTIDIDSTGTLSIRPGTTVYVMSTATEINVEGSLLLLGTEASPIEIKPHSELSELQHWNGITLEDDAIFRSSYASIWGADDFHCSVDQYGGPETVLVEDTRIFGGSTYGCDVTLAAFDVENGDTVLVDGGQFLAVNRVEAEDAVIKNSKIRQTVKGQLFVIPPALKMTGSHSCEGDTIKPSFRNSTVEAQDICITVTGRDSDVQIGEKVILRNKLERSTSIGIKAQVEAKVTVDEVKVDEGTYIGTGIQATSDSELDIERLFLSQVYNYGIYVGAAGLGGSVDGYIRESDFTTSFVCVDLSPDSCQSHWGTYCIANNSGATFYASNCYWGTSWCSADDCPEVMFTGVSADSNLTSANGGFDWIDAPNFNVGPGSAPQVDRLAFSIYPNPGNPTFTIEFAHPITKPRQEVKLYEISGRLVRVLYLYTGESTVNWDGRDRFGRDVASGVYFASVATDSEALTKKVVLIR